MPWCCILNLLNPDMKSYGITERKEGLSDFERILESITLKGYHVEEAYLDENVCNEFQDALERVYDVQKEEFTENGLASIQESDMVRMPFAYARKFTELFMDDFVLKVVRRMLGANVNLHLQNAIINRPNKEHHQTSWHRDLPYQDYVISKPLGLNAFYCLSDFKEETGSTFLLPFSHKIDHFPSIEFVEENAVQLEAKKGSLVFFDSMIYHKAGYNSSVEDRYGVNHLFVAPILKQQIDLPAFLGDEFTEDESMRAVLGYSFKTPKSVLDFRNRRANK